MVVWRWSQLRMATLGLAALAVGAWVAGDASGPRPATAEVRAPVASPAEEGRSLAPHQAARVRAAESFLRQEVARAGFPGGAFALLAGGRVVNAGAFGLRDREAQLAATTKTPYWVASITKALTGLAVLHLERQGRLQLDAPVRRYLPWFTLSDADAAADLTVADLLRHQSGLPTNAHRIVWDDEERIRPSMRAAVEALAKVGLTGNVRERFEYSNMNYAVLGFGGRSGVRNPVRRLPAQGTVRAACHGSDRVARSRGSGRPRQNVHPKLRHLA